KRLVDRDRTWRACQQRVAVRGTVRDRLRANIATGARAVLDNDRLIPFLAKLFGNDPRQRVGRSTRWKRHDDLDAFRWITGGIRSAPNAGVKRDKQGNGGDRDGSGNHD